MSRKKASPSPSERCGRSESSPTSFLTSWLEGLWVWSLWLAVLSRGDANPSCLSQLDGFMRCRLRLGHCKRHGTIVGELTKARFRPPAEGGRDQRGRNQGAGHYRVQESNLRQVSVGSEHNKLEKADEACRRQRE